VIEFLYQALLSERGIVIETDSVEWLRAKLYASRRQTHDEDLMQLSLVPSPTNVNQLWIVRK